MATRRGSGIGATPSCSLGVGGRCGEGAGGVRCRPSVPVSCSCGNEGGAAWPRPCETRQVGYRIPFTSPGDCSRYQCLRGRTSDERGVYCPSNSSRRAAPLRRRTCASTPRHPGVPAPALPVRPACGPVQGPGVFGPRYTAQGAARPGPGLAGGGGARRSRPGAPAALAQFVMSAPAMVQGRPW